ncbi:MAG TPA: tetratricopeptide repeat protein, partial [Gemmatimonadaceae bacterium]
MRFAIGLPPTTEPQRLARREAGAAGVAGTATPPGMASQRDRDVLRSFARRINPNDAGAHNNLGVLYYNKGLHDEAVSAFQRAL